MTEDVHTTTVSTKGQVILPAAIRKRRQWTAGTRLSVEETPEGVLLRPTRAFPHTTEEQVFGCLNYSGQPKSLEEMQAGIAAEARRRHARGRY
jgi:AbrB family looped-hinge helix DNA binding protein